MGSASASIDAQANGAIREGCPVLFCYFIYYPMHQPFNLNGTYFDLSHLNPIKAKTTAKLRAGEKKVTVQLEFSCHCWSRKPAEGETIPPTHLVPDGSKEMPRNRIFCEGRYELSKALPEVIDKMLTSSGRIHKTKKKNIVRIDWVAPVVPGAPVTEYFVFMKLEKREPAESKSTSASLWSQPTQRMFFMTRSTMGSRFPSRN
jgi:hypothetical protein